MKRSIPILMYHHVSPDREITPEAFERQMQVLLRQGYQSLSMDEIIQIVRGEQPMLARGFAVTFDDGYFDNWVFVYPILKRLGVKAAMYLVTSRVEEHEPRREVRLTDTKTNERGSGGFLSWSEAREMADSGLVTFGSHTHTHRHWIRRQEYENLEIELRDSKAMIEEELKRPCYHLAWPWGDYETAWWPMLERLDYRSAVTTRSGANTVGTNPFALQRVRVSRGASEWLLSRLRWHANTWAASGFGLLHGCDRRLKQWVQRESPYSHG